MIVLVTGTGGFIGAATALKLKEQGHGEPSWSPHNQKAPAPACVEHL